MRAGPRECPQGKLPYGRDFRETLAPNFMQPPFTFPFTASVMWLMRSMSASIGFLAGCRKRHAMMKRGVPGAKRDRTLTARHVWMAPVLQEFFSVMVFGGVRSCVRRLRRT